MIYIKRLYLVIGKEKIQREVQLIHNPIKYNVEQLVSEYLII